MNLSRSLSVALVALTGLLTGCAEADDDANPASEEAAGEAVGSQESNLSSSCTLQIGAVYAQGASLRATIVPSNCGSTVVQVFAYENGRETDRATVSANKISIVPLLPATSVHASDVGYGKTTVTILAIIGDPRSPSRRASKATTFFQGPG